MGVKPRGEALKDSVGLHWARSMRLLLPSVTWSGVKFPLLRKFQSAADAAVKGGVLPVVSSVEPRQPWHEATARRAVSAAQPC